MTWDARSLAAPYSISYNCDVNTQLPLLFSSWVEKRGWTCMNTSVWKRFHRLLQWKEKWRHSFHYLLKPPREAQPALLTSASSPLLLCNFTWTPFMCIYYIIISLHALILLGGMKEMWTFDDDRSLELDAADTLRPPQVIISALFYRIVSLHFLPQNKTPRPEKFTNVHLEFAANFETIRADCEAFRQQFGGKYVLEGLLENELRQTKGAYFALPVRWSRRWLLGD